MLLLWSLNYLKRCIFFNFVLTSAKNLSLLKQFKYIYIWKILSCIFKKWCCLLCYDYFEEIMVWSRTILLNFCWVSISHDILSAYISLTLAQTPVNHITLYKSVMRAFRCINVDWVNRFRFLAEVSTKLQKMHFLDNLRTTTQEGKLETQQMIPFFHLLFAI